MMDLEQSLLARLESAHPGEVWRRIMRVRQGAATLAELYGRD